MNKKARWTLMVAALWAACCTGTSSKAATKEEEEAAAMMSNYDAEERAAIAARQKDATWKPACKQVGLIQIGDSKKPGALKNFCLNSEGNILACYAPKEVSSKNPGAIRVYSPKGELLNTIALEIKPGAVSVGKDGSIFVAGDGRLLKLSPEGKVLASADSPVAAETVKITKETEDMVREMIKQTKKSFEVELANMKASLERRRAEVTGLTVTEQDVFMAVPAPSDFTFRVYRFDHALQNTKLVVEKLRGCCGQMDIQSQGEKLWIPHNARHAVESHDRDGKELSKFGKAGRVKAADFGGCCEPKNLRVLANGDILAAESGPPTCIKRFTANGKFKEVIALVNDSNGSKYYMLDTTRDAIRIFAAKS